MSLQQILNRIHSTRNPNELNSKLNSFKQEINSELSSGDPFQENYYKNHTGRELYRKLNNFGMGSEIIAIGDNYDAGFRPLTVDGIKGLAITFSPSSLPSLISWYDASDASTITHLNGTVSAWADKSSNSNDLSAGDNPITNSSTQNSLNVFDLDGGDFFKLNNFSTPLSGNLQAFIVCKVTVVDNAADSVLAMDASSNDWQLQAGTNGSFRGAIVFANQPDSGTGNGSVALDNEWHIFCVDLDFTDNQQYQLLMDGEQLAGTNIRTYDSKLASSVVFRIFGNRAENRFPEGQVAEVILLDSTSNSDRQKVEGYLAHKWGLESLLASSHPHKDNPPS